MNACGRPARARLRPAPSCPRCNAGYSIAGLGGGAAIGGGLGPGSAQPARWPRSPWTAGLLIILGLLARAARVSSPPSRPPREAPRRPAPPFAAGRSARWIWVLGLLALCGQVGEGSGRRLERPSTCTSTWARPVGRPPPWRWARSRSRWRRAGWRATAWPRGSARCGWSGRAALVGPGSAWRFGLLVGTSTAGHRRLRPARAWAWPASSRRSSRPAARLDPGAGRAQTSAGSQRCRTRALLSGPGRDRRDRLRRGACGDALLVPARPGPRGRRLPPGVDESPPVSLTARNSGQNRVFSGSTPRMAS